jgi:hypothetical protein
MPGADGAVRPVKAELAAAWGFVPFVAMGQTYPASHLAAIDFGQAVVKAVDAAAEIGDHTRARPGHAIIADAWGEEGVTPWANSYRDYLSQCGILTTEGAAVLPGPQWEAFRKKFRERLPHAATDDLQADMREELAAWLKERTAKQDDSTDSERRPQDEEWLPASEAVRRPQVAGMPVTMSWISRSAEKQGVKIRPKQLAGKHTREIECNS